MLSPRSGSRAQAVVVALVLLVAEHVWAGPLRISNLVVTNSERTLLVHLVLLGSLPEVIVEGLGTGIPATVRFQVELWQSVSWWVDRRIAAKILERQVVYDVLTKEYRVTAVQGEERDPYVTRDIWEAERVLSDVRGAPALPDLEPAASRTSTTCGRGPTSGRAPPTRCPSSCRSGRRGSRRRGSSPRC